MRSTCRPKTAFIYVIGIVILLVQSSSVGFGKNKVQYSRLHWRTYSAPHFEIFFHQDQGDLPLIAYHWVDHAYRSLSRRLQFTHREKVPLLLYADPNLFEQTNVITEVIPEEVGGFTELFKNRVVVPFNGSLDDFRHVLHHELVHAFVFGIFSDQVGGSVLTNSAMQVPLWFNEGAAEYLSSGWNIEADMFLMDQAVNGAVPLPGQELSGYMAYKGGQSFLFFLAASRGDSTFTQFIREFKRTKTVENAAQKVYGVSIEELGKEWHQELKRLYWPEIGRRLSPEKNASAVTSHLESRDHFNLRPRISPDGSKVAFFSDRRDYTRIMVTDRKGKILHEISQNGYGGFFESFHPFRSGMCWSPDGGKLCFVTKQGGQDQIRIVDIKGRRRERVIKTRLTSMFSPDWDRTGTQLVFSGIAGGRSDLYLYDLDSDSLRQLTNSPELESDPRFSPDSKRIIFGIQDTSGDPAHAHSPYGRLPTDLATLELHDGTLTRLTHTSWSEKQPCYTQDGARVVCVSDRNGIDNLYIGSPDSLDHAKPMTDYLGGCSNPDWSHKGTTLVFSLFQKQGWDVWVMDKPLTTAMPDTLAHTRWVQSCLDTSQHFFTPAPVKDHKKAARADSLGGKKKLAVPVRTDDSVGISEELPDSLGKPPVVSDSLAAPADSSRQAMGVSTGDDTIGIGQGDTTGHGRALAVESAPARPRGEDTTARASIDSGRIALAPPSRSDPYRLRFSPDMVALGLGMSTFYGYAGQWLLALSDIMGDHRITLAGDVQGNLQDYAHLAGSYLYLRDKLDVGIGGYYSKDYTAVSISGEKSFHDTDFGGFGLARYPFSLFSRIDVELFARRITREPVGFDTTKVVSNSLLSSLSYSFDNILWGLTGPLNGIRATASVQLSPPLDFVDEHFVSFDMDFRSYLHLAKRFVWANRFFGGASYPLGDREPARRFLLGGNENWFLYEVNLDEYDRVIGSTFYSSFVTPFRGWRYIDRSGTRVAVLNSEFRFPFIREISIAWPLPLRMRYINGAAFADVGNAWDTDEEIEGFPLPRQVLGGLGLGLRANLGIFVLRFDRAWPTDWNRIVGPFIDYYSLGAEF